MNIKSFEKIMSNLDNNELNNLAKNLTDNLPKDEDWKLDFRIWTHWEIDSILENAWYESDWILWPWESEMITTTIINYSETQENIWKKNFQEISKILFDFDEDWDLDINKRLYVWETQMFKNIWIEDFSEDEFLILMKNLWILKWEENLNDLKTNLWKNLFNTRQKVKTQLFRLIAAWIKPWALTVKNWLAEFVWKEIQIQDKFLKNYIDKLDISYKEKEEIKKSINTIDHDLLISPRVQKILEKVKPEYKKWFLEKIKLEAIWIMLWEKTWVWTSFNHEDFSNNFVESHLALWAIWWIFWFIVTKDVLDFWRKNDEKKEEIEFWEEDLIDNISLNVWTANFIPFASVDWEFFKPDSDKIKEDFPLEIDWKISLSAYAWWTAWIQAIWIWINKIDENTQKWISLMKRNMTWVLHEFTEAIKNWKNFDENFSKLKEKELNLKEWELEWFRKIFDEMKNFYNSVWEDENIKNKFLNSVKDWYLTHYENKLIENAKWLNFSQAWFWVAFLSWFLPLPFVTASAEYIRQNVIWEKWRWTLAEMLTTRTEKYKEFWIKKSPSWKNAYKIEWIWKDCISSSNPDLQVEFENWNAYISWIDFSKPENQITITNYKKHNGEVNILVIWEWNSTAWRLELSNHKWITEDVKWWTETEVHQTIENLNLVPELAEFKWETRDLIEKISFVMNKWALKIKWVQALINSIATAKKSNNKNDFNSAWRKLNWVIFWNEWKMWSYLTRESRKKWWKINSFKALKNEFNDVKNEEWTDKQKNQRKSLILNSILSNVMKDERLDWKTLANNEKSSWRIDKKYKNLKTLDDWQEAYNKNPNNVYKNIPLKYYDQIKQYGKKWLREKSRTESFAKTLEKTTWVSKTEIDSKNQEYYKKFKEWTSKKDVNVNYYNPADKDSNLIAFPAPSENDLNWVIPRTWIIEYADVSWNWEFDDFTEIWKEEWRKLVKQLPDETLLNLLNQISKWFWWDEKNTMNNATKEWLIKIIQNWKNESWTIKIDYTPILFKWWKCFNTSLWIKDLNVSILNTTTKTTWTNWKISVWHAKINETYVAENLATIIWVAITWKKEEKEVKESKKEWGETKPWNTDEIYKDSAQTPSSQKTIDEHVEIVKQADSHIKEITPTEKTQVQIDNQNNINWQITPDKVKAWVDNDF